jgi:hypothetical protein
MVKAGVFSPWLFKAVNNSKKPMVKSENKKKSEKPFQSTHNLSFEVGGPFRWDVNFTHFQVGTVTGLWATIDQSYVILAVLNSEPGNGHLIDVWDWFEFSCRRDHYSLKVIEILEKRFIDHLIKKRGFKELTGNSVVKTFI